MLLFREIKNILFYFLKMGKNILSFIFESLLFLIVSLVAGFLISSALFYLATQFTQPFKKALTLTLVASIVIFYSYQFLQTLKKEYQILNSKIPQKIYLYIASFTFSSPYFFPKWIKNLSYFLLVTLPLIPLLTSILYLLSFFLVHSLNIQNPLLISINQSIPLAFQIASNLFSSHTPLISFLIFQLLALSIIPLSKPILLKKKYQSSPLNWFFFLVNAQTFLLFLILYFNIIYSSIIPFFSKTPSS